MASLLCPFPPDPMRDQLSRIEVAGGGFKVLHSTAVRKIHVEPSTIAPSSIPALRRQRNALGLYCPNGAEEGAFLAVYLGPIEEAQYAKLLLLTGYGSHVQQGKKYFVNGAYEHPEFTFPRAEKVRWGLLDYVTHRAVGNMINDYTGSDSGEPNCSAVVLQTSGIMMPYAPTGELVVVPEAVFFRASRHIRPGEEILRSVGDVYRRAYIEGRTFSRDMILLDRYPSREGVDEQLQEKRRLAAEGAGKTAANAKTDGTRLAVGDEGPAVGDKRSAEGPAVGDTEGDTAGIKEPTGGAKTEAVAEEVKDACAPRAPSAPRSDTSSRRPCRKRKRNTAVVPHV